MSDLAHSYYLATANPAPPRPALTGDVNVDVCVVGGGYTGLSAALHLAERGYRTVLLEARQVGWGASGRNGGQLNSGLRKGASELIGMFGRERAKRLWDLAEEAKATVRERVRRHAIACDLKSGGLFVAHKRSDLAWMADEVRAQHDVFGYDAATLLSKAELEERLASPRFHGGVSDRGAGHLHPLNYALGLAAAAEAAGARIYEESAAISVAPGEVRTKSGRVNARYIVLGCNAYLDGLEQRIAGNIMPISNYIIATEPLGEAGARALIRDDAAVCDTKFVVNYFRLSADRRLLFGGGETYSRTPPRDIAAFVRPYMLRVFPQLADKRIDHAWGGQLAITMNRLPHFGRLPGDIYFAHGYSGQGVALTSLAGKLIAEAVAGTAERFDVFARLPHPSFPGGTLLRKPLLVLGMLWFALRDRL
ncbi:MAG: gamma-glutamylputrescine oxidase [Rhodospirillaceae bacterium]|jgi:gamma-glutamylputrescine oxidase|nr:gamma-glutamylputrescine oxidase [Rhodospirillaceae bacterium]